MAFPSKMDSKLLGLQAEQEQGTEAVHQRLAACAHAVAGAKHKREEATPLHLQAHGAKASTNGKHPRVDVVRSTRTNCLAAHSTCRSVHRSHPAHLHPSACSQGHAKLGPPSACPQASTWASMASLSLSTASSSSNMAAGAEGGAQDGSERSGSSSACVARHWNDALKGGATRWDTSRPARRYDCETGQGHTYLKFWSRLCTGVTPAGLHAYSHFFCIYACVHASVCAAHACSFVLVMESVPAAYELLGCCTRARSSACFCSWCV